MKTHYINSVASDENMEGAPGSVARREFARRLSRMLVDKGWNQSELARRAAAYMPDGKAMGRDNISSYVRGRTMPTPVKLDALCKTFDCQPADLLPTRGVPNVTSDAPAVSVRDAGEGNAWLQINQNVPWPVAIDILGLLRKAEIG